MDKFRNYIVEKSFNNDEYPNIFRSLKEISKDRQLVESMTPSDEILKENFNQYSLNRVERWLSRLSEDDFKSLTTSKSKDKIKKVIGEKEDVGERALDIFNAWIDGEFCVESKILHGNKQKDENQKNIKEVDIPNKISDEAKEAIKAFLDEAPRDTEEARERIGIAVEAIIKAIDGKKVSVSEAGHSQQYEDAVKNAVDMVKNKGKNPDKILGDVFKSYGVKSKVGSPEWSEEIYKVSDSDIADLASEVADVLGVKIEDLFDKNYLE